MTKLKSPIRYAGGKGLGRKHIIQYIPPDVETLMSPFFGGGSVELACIDMGIKVKGYDVFDLLVNFWQQALWDAPSLALKASEFYPLEGEAGKKKFRELQGLLKLQKSLNSVDGVKSENFSKVYKTGDYDSLERAAWFYVVNRASFSGLTLSGGMAAADKFTQSALDYMRGFQVPLDFDGESMLEVNFGSFETTIPSHPDDFLYCDPPYLIASDNLYGQSGNLHKEFDLSQHEKLAELLNSRGRWILSYNDCEFVRDSYGGTGGNGKGGHKFVKAEWNYGLGKNRQPADSNEVIILSSDL